MPFDQRPEPDKTHDAFVGHKHQSATFNGAAWDFVLPPLCRGFIGHEIAPELDWGKAPLEKEGR